MLISSTSITSKASTTLAHFHNNSNSNHQTLQPYENGSHTQTLATFINVYLMKEILQSKNFWLKNFKKKIYQKKIQSMKFEKIFKI